MNKVLIHEASINFYCLHYEIFNHKHFISYKTLSYDQILYKLLKRRNLQYDRTLEKRNETKT